MPRPGDAPADELSAAAVPTSVPHEPRIAVATSASGTDSGTVTLAVDPGAALIVASMADTLEKPAADERTVTVINLHSVRNLSRASADEFARFLDRFAALLTQAGTPHAIEFVRTAPAAHYRMQGVAYLITDAGLDQWEMYLSIAPADRDVAVWDARQVIRVLRNARPGQPQILSIGR